MLYHLLRIWAFTSFTSKPQMPHLTPTAFPHSHALGSQHLLAVTFLLLIRHILPSYLLRPSLP